MEEITEATPKTGSQTAVVVLLSSILVVLSCMGLFMWTQRERHWSYQQCLVAAMKLDHGGSLVASERTRYYEDC